MICDGCGGPVYGPLMFGEIVCDDPDCKYATIEEDETETQGEN